MEVIEVKNFYNGEVSGYIFKLFEKRKFNSQKEEELKRFIPDIKNQFLYVLAIIALTIPIAFGLHLLMNVIWKKKKS